jgi:hypothetical protein
MVPLQLCLGEDTRSSDDVERATRSRARAVEEDE